MRKYCDWSVFYGNTSEEEELVLYAQGKSNLVRMGKLTEDPRIKEQVRILKRVEKLGYDVRAAARNSLRRRGITY